MRRIGIAVLVVVVAATGLFFGVRAAWNKLIGPPDPNCSFAQFTTTTDQAATASEMTAVVIRRKLPERAAVLVLAAGLQESKLRNISAGDGDRDSVGVLQQRPSQGWGTAARLADPGYATGRFLDRLVKNPRWKTDDLSTVIQKVQVSADGSLYGQHEEQAQAMADALTGATTRAISCSFPKPDVVAAARVVAAQVHAELGIATPTVSGSDITAPGASWATAGWFLANADRLGIDEVRCGGARWQRGKKWRTDAGVGKAGVVAVLHH